MRFRRTERFRTSFRRLDDGARRIAEMQLRRFAVDPFQPPLRARPIAPWNHYWEMFVTSRYRIVWRFDDVDPERVILYDIGVWRTREPFLPPR